MKTILIRFAMLCALSTPALADVKVVDGDTLVIDGITYRINGIDAPESGQKCKFTSGRNWNCGDAATEALHDLVSNRTPKCESIAVDIYDRNVARCFVGKTDIAEELVEKGMAWAFLKFSDEYEAAQNNAKTAKRGIWRGPAQPAWDFRAAKWQAAEQKSPEGCPIKGNITKNGKIYHAPWSPWYNRTRINKSKGERWFCDELEAKKAGWRAPYWK